MEQAEADGEALSCSLSIIYCNDVTEKKTLSVHRKPSATTHLFFFFQSASNPRMDSRVLHYTILSVKCWHRFHADLIQLLLLINFRN